VSLLDHNVVPNSYTLETFLSKYSYAPIDIYIIEQHGLKYALKMEQILKLIFKSNNDSAITKNDKIYIRYVISNKSRNVFSQ
jgi:hypothetical protein